MLIYINVSLDSCTSIHTVKAYKYNLTASVLVVNIFCMLVHAFRVVLTQAEQLAGMSGSYTSVTPTY